MKDKKKIFAIIIVIIIVILSLIIYYLLDDKKGIPLPNTNYDYSDTDTSYGEDAISITFENNTITSNGNVTIKDSMVTITTGGTYLLQGELSNGSVIVDAKDEDVHLIFNGIKITSEKSAPICIKASRKTVITLAENTNNELIDTKREESDEVDGALFSKDNLTINGLGNLIITANHKDGIVSNDGLKIMSGNITITSVGDGIRGKDYVAIKDGTFIIDANNDGIKSTNATDSLKGYIQIEEGTFTITAEEDGIQAETGLTIHDGEFIITTGGGAKTTSNQDLYTTTDTISKKGLKATTLIMIEGGTFTLNCADDAIHTNDGVTIKNGTFQIQSGDDGIHADKTLEISGGTITISKSYEGLEANDITINGGDIKITSSDDGINAAGETTVGQRGCSSCVITISGGNILVDSSGDGIDSNGDIFMEGGTLLINGPTNSGNGALDYDNEFIMNGGILLAASSSGMAQNISASSSQYGVLINFTTNQSSNSLVTIMDEGEEIVIGFSPTKNYGSLVVSTPDLKKNSTYSIYTGGTGTLTNGVLNQINSLGTSYTGFTINTITTNVGNSGGMGGGMMPPGRR